MKPGDVRVFESGRRRAVVVAVGVWAERKKANLPIHIHLTATPRFHTTVTNQPGSKRCHDSLFEKLKLLLEEHGRWPFDD